MLLSKNIPELTLKPDFITESQANKLWSELSALPLVADPIKLFGKVYPIPRKHLFMGDDDLIYSYSNIPLKAHVWTPHVKDLLTSVNDFCDTTFNSLLINFYQTGRDSNGWHSDNERELGPDPQLFSLSMGGARAFNIRKKGTTRMCAKILLEDRMALWMKKGFQSQYEHCIPKTSKEVAPRFNLTFRKIV